MLSRVKQFESSSNMLGCEWPKPELFENVTKVKFSMGSSDVHMLYHSFKQL